jgi:UMF1 family MFS transporter
VERQLDKKKVWSWALYDWANSAFATTVVAGFFPVFFKEYWSAGMAVTTSTFQLGLANTVESLLIALIAPVMGAIADKGGAKKKFLFAFTALGVVMTTWLYFIAQGDWVMAIVAFVLAGVGFSAANIFYDSLIVNVTTEQKADFVSALGFALGYLGGGLLFAVNVVMLLFPASFGLADQAAAVRMSFLTVAVWWALFSIPLFLFVQEPPGTKTAVGLAAVGAGWRQLLATFREIRRLRVVFLFLAAYWLYIDAVGTIIRMAIDYGLALGFDSSQLIQALLLTQFVAFPAALAFGYLGERLGAKAGIFIAIGVYLGVSVWAMNMYETWEFYGLAATIGLVQGGIQSLSRSFYVRLIPVNKAAEFFGFYNMLGKLAAVLGPVLMGVLSVATGNPRLSMLALIALFVAGAVLLYFVDEKEGLRMAREMERT